MHARMSTLEGSTDELDEGLRDVKEHVLLGPVRSGLSRQPELRMRTPTSAQNEPTKMKKPMLRSPSATIEICTFHTSITHSPGCVEVEF